VALAAANRFLRAWQEGDHEAGLLLLTDNAKRQTSAAQLEKFFTPASGIVRGYLVARGRKLNLHRYTFPITIFEARPGSERAPVHVHDSSIVVFEDGNQEWAIDKIP